ncbi:uncharacterized protein LOC131657894 [Vicia villosa]|uniref:uncharacterized protein LOC131657894 n=1 Tax=Vicia villosa TaxID=3911 RepID=UPI00273C8D7F|nr:uncharacterized protein LOC131657894 [Vicia villosa]
MRGSSVGKWQKVREGGRREVKWDIAREGKRMAKGSETSSSFFITEFRDRWRARDLYFEFKELGDIEEVVIPPRKDRFGRRFGFVRFLNVKDEELMATKLDNMILEGRKLFANLPRFSRPKDAEQSGFAAQKSIPAKANTKGTGGNRLDGIGYGTTVNHQSYVDVIRSSNGSFNFNEGNKVPKTLFFKPCFEDVSQYKKAFTGRIKESGKMEDIKKLFLEEGIFSIRVTVLGPNLYLLEDLIEGEVELFVEERKSWWVQWFSSIKQWEPKDRDEERVTWLRVLGVPCHAWSEICFKQLVDTKGVFVRCDEGTVLKKRMDEAIICIRTKIRERLDDMVKLSIDGQLFVVSLLEDSFGTTDSPKLCSLGEE